MLSVTRPIGARLRDATKPSLIEVAPDRYAPVFPDIPLADYVLTRPTLQPDGTHRLVPIREAFVRLDPKLAALLGFPGRAYNTIRRLGKAGFIELIVIAPHTTILNLDSWYNHLRRCAEDPEFWAPEGKACRAYKEAL